MWREKGGGPAVGIDDSYWWSRPFGVFSTVRALDNVAKQDLTTSTNVVG